METELFERWARGVRLTSAGELFAKFARDQLDHGARIQSTLEDLKGLKRGHIAIACSQALIYHYLPTQISRFQSLNPLVSFSTRISDHDQAINALIAYEVDLAIAYNPTPSPMIRELAVIPQRIMVLMPHGHPLTARPDVRISDLSHYSLVMPDVRYGARQLLDNVAARRNIKFSIRVESDSFELLRGMVVRGDAVSMQIEIGTPEPGQEQAFTTRPLADREATLAPLILCQLHNRSLSVAAAKFAESIAADFETRNGLNSTIV
jgi:DNA-binding transcriptional LysR family regulator